MIKRSTSPEGLGLILGLAVDDTRAIRRLMVQTLWSAGCIPIPACNGYLGWKMTESLRPDLVVTDLEMPHWGGLQMIEAIRCSSDYWVRQIPIIVCSRTDDSWSIREAFDVGADTFLAKPIDIAELRRAIHQVIRRNRDNLNVDMN